MSRPSWQLPQVKRLPEGYHKLSVIVTTRERDRLRGAAALQPHGTFSEAIRKAMGMSPNAHRLKHALTQQAELEAAEDADSTNNEE